MNYRSFVPGLLLSLLASGPICHSSAWAEEAKPARKKLPNGILMNFKDASLDAVLENLSEMTGLAIVNDLEIEGKVNIISRKPLTVDEAISLLNSILKDKGYASIRTGKTLKIYKLEEAKKRNVPVRSGNDPAEVEPNEEIITQVITLRYADAMKLKKDLAPLIPSYADLSANASSNSLILTDTGANVRRIMEIISYMDTHLSSIAQVRVFRLQYSRATNAAKLINQIFKEETRRQSSNQGRFPFFRSSFFRGGGAGGSSSSQSGGSEAASTPQQKINAAADEETNTLVVTAPADTMKVVEEVIKEMDSLDTHMATVSQVKVFHLTYADASNTAKLINQVFNPEDQRSGGSRRPGGFFGFSPFSRFSRGGQQSQTSPTPANQRINAAADERTNTIVVTAPQDTLTLIDEVVKDLDANPAEEKSVFIYHLKNAQAKNLETVLNSLFEKIEEPLRTANNGGGQQGSVFARRNQQGMSGRPGNSGGRSGRTAPTQRPGFSAGAGQPSSGANQAAQELAGQVNVVANEDTNSLMVMTAPKYFDKVKDIISEMDMPIPQVVIKVLIAEVTHNNSLDLGTELSISNLRASGRGPSLRTDFDVAQQAGGFFAMLVEKDVSATLRFLETIGTLDVLSRPYIVASDNQEATITVGDEVPFIRNTRTTETGQTINTIQYEDIGIILTVTPHINPDGVVIMTVNAEVSTITGQTVPISETVSAPVFAKRSANSRVAVNDGQTVVIGGMMEDRQTDTIRRVPVLGNIPVLGALFRRKIKENAKTELILFLTPHVAENAEELKKISDEEKANVKVVPNAVKPGTFEQHLKGMRIGNKKPPAVTEPEQKAPAEKK